MSSATVMANYPRTDLVTHGIQPATTGQNGAVVVPGVLTQAPSWRFHRSESKLLGSMQVVFGSIYVVCGSVLAASIFPSSFHIGVSFWGALTYIITGFLTIVAVNSFNRRLIDSSVGMNVLCAVTAGIIIALLAVDIAGRMGLNSCHNSWSPGCLIAGNSFGQLQMITFALLGVSVFQLLISITTSAFGCKAACSTEPVVTAVSVTPSQAASFTVVSASQALSAQQNVFYITNPNTNLNNPLTEDPPVYSAFTHKAND